MPKFESYCCQACGENIGWIQRFLFFGLFHTCTDKDLNEDLQESIYENNLLKAKKHALLALSHWKDCKQDSDFIFRIDKDGRYIRLGLLEAKE